MLFMGGKRHKGTLTVSAHKGRRRSVTESEEALRFKRDMLLVEIKTIESKMSMPSKSASGGDPTIVFYMTHKSCQSKLEAIGIKDIFIGPVLGCNAGTVYEGRNVARL